MIELIITILALALCLGAIFVLAVCLATLDGDTQVEDDDNVALGEEAANPSLFNKELHRADRSL